MYHNLRQTTPPSINAVNYYPDSAESHLTNPNFFGSADNSPDSILTDITSPTKSPGSSIKVYGPPLLPKIRCQDQTTEPTAGPVRPVARAVSTGPHAPPSLLTYALQRPMYHRRATSPPEGQDPITTAYSISTSPESASTLSTSLSSVTSMTASTTFGSMMGHSGVSPSPGGSNFGSTLNSPIEMAAPQSSRRSSLAHVRTASAPIVAARGHSRSASNSSSVDEATIWRHGYPTQYRQVPQYVTAASLAQSTPALAAPMMQQSYSAESNFMMPGDPGNVLMGDFTYNGVMPAERETMSVISYLSTPNPTPALVVRTVIGMSKNRDWFWWDVRNLRSWSDFSIDTMMSPPDFPRLLTFPFYVDQLPHPPRSSPTPETEHNLRKIYADFFSVKVNAALAQTQGERSLIMQAVNSATSSTTPKPDFISNYHDDIAFNTLNGERRGRLVGIVKAYDQWNTGLRSKGAPDQIRYLAGLSHLHRVMREHGCRYGFIITEIELLCVRAGAEDDAYNAKDKSNEAMGHNSLDDGPLPIFGWLETAAPIPLSLSGLDPETNAPRLTAGLALWYLHMLAKEHPLEGQPCWNMAVSGVAAHTRKNCRDRDVWMPKVQQYETRDPKRVRGWVYPQDPVNRKEYPNKKRRGAGH